MTKFSAQDKHPEYADILARQTPVSGQDFYPVLFDSILSDEELQDIQTFFDKYPVDNIKVQAYSGLGTLSAQFKNQEEIIKRIEKLASDAVGEDLEVLDFGGTRYSREFGWEAKLGPHYDARPIEMYVLDFHVKSNEDWKLFFEGDEFSFSDNQGLLFSGTGTIHWREPIRIRDDSRIDLIFFWLQHKNPRPISEEHTRNMKERQNFFLKNIDPVSPLSKDDWWKPIRISDNAERYPHYQKISTETKDPVRHNEMYQYVLDRNQLDTFYSDYILKENKLTLVDIDKKVLDGIITKMTHVYAESSINFIDSHIFRLNNLEDDLGSMFYQKRKDGQKSVSILFPLGVNDKIKINIDEKDFTLNTNMCITFSETDQEVRILDTNNSIDFLVCSFEINKKDNEYV
jgi:hypothetical protein